ncbi:DUF2199 domain-containing protein [Amycolatopsis sp. NPDC049159]|uniref:DUF2199 domain-containing protein n=1 Tax=Amycolatopsis sp. NPDC049159 TaxID=3157210 RepID=UPI0033EAB5CE
MPDTTGYTCTSCGEHHDELPFAYSTPAPAFRRDDPADVLEPERCVIGGEHYFLRGRLVLPVLDAEEHWNIPQRTAEPPYFGWLATELPGYEPGTLNLKTNLHTRPPGERPLIELEPTGHPSPSSNGTASR